MSLGRAGRGSSAGAAGWLFDQGPDLVQSGDALKDGVRLVVEAMLQAPKFLYRIEVGKGTSDPNGVLLMEADIAGVSGTNGHSGSHALHVLNAVGVPPTTVKSSRSFARRHDVVRGGWRSKRGVL